MYRRKDEIIQSRWEFGVWGTRREDRVTRICEGEKKRRERKKKKHNQEFDN